MVELRIEMLCDTGKERYADTVLHCGLNELDPTTCGDQEGSEKNLVLSVNGWCADWVYSYIQETQLEVSTDGGYGELIHPRKEL